MKVTIDWLEKKSDDWKLATLTNEKGEQQEEVSINRKDKDGNVFPDFDNLKPGMTIEGSPWTSAKGKHYLFPPKQELQKGAERAGGYQRGGGMKMMQEKAKNIEEAQQRKAESISYFNSVNSAIALYAAISGKDPNDNGAEYVREFIINWRDWFLKEYEKWDSQPF